MCHKILIANTREDSLTLKDGSICKTIFLSKLIEEKGDNWIQESNILGPYDIDIGEEGYIYIANAYDNSIMKIDIENIKLLEFIKVGRNPTCIKRFKDKIYVANSDSNSISIIDEKTFSLIEDISVGERPTDIQIDEDGLKVFIANGNCYTINVLNLNTEKISSIILSKQPVKMVIEDKRLFVLSYVNNGVTNYSNLSELKAEDYKTIMSIDLKGIFGNFIKIRGEEIFYLSNMEDGYIYRVFIDKEVNVSKIHLGGMPNNIKWDGKTKLYIANILDNNLTIIDKSNNEIVDNIRVGKEPNGILLL
ncbi:YncE family protein [Tissierella praeacuta]|uniref:YncE family protein n=1 Tax=Tissierella praeacuta TaxID=43131 RepID=UPI003341C796